MVSFSTFFFNELTWNYPYEVELYTSEQDINKTHRFLKHALS